MSNKYKNFVIYKIFQTINPDIIYIGSTTNFNQRKAQHKKNIKNKVSKKYKYPLYQYIRTIGCWEDFTMEILLKYPCETKQEGLKKEKEMIEQHKAQLNNMKPIK
jgi:predicted GIY-YIG superfamily endonuclease